VDKTLQELIALMHAHHVRRVPIMDGGAQVVGLITLDDLAVLLGRELAELGKGIAIALFSKPPQVEEPELVPPFGWLMSYL
jgi:CBS domain-containing protein